MIFGVTFATGLRKSNSSTASGLRPPDFSRDVRSDELVLVALVVLERQHGSAKPEALDPLDEPRPVGGAAELAVGDDLKADVLLHPNGIADALILHAGEVRRRRFRARDGGGTPDGARRAATGCRRDRRETAGGGRYASSSGTRSRTQVDGGGKAAHVGAPVVFLVRGGATVARIGFLRRAGAAPDAR